MRNEHILFGEYSQVGVRPDLPPDEALSLARVLIGSEQYQNPGHPDSAIVKRDVGQLYTIANQPAEDA